MLLNCYMGNFRYTNAQKLLTSSKYGAHDKHIKGDKERWKLLKKLKDLEESCFHSSQSHQQALVYRWLCQHRQLEKDFTIFWRKLCVRCTSTIVCFYCASASTMTQPMLPSFHNFLATTSIWLGHSLFDKRCISTWNIHMWLYNATSQSVCCPKHKSWTSKYEVMFIQHFTCSFILMNVHLVIKSIRYKHKYSKRWAVCMTSKLAECKKYLESGSDQLLICSTCNGH